MAHFAKLNTSNKVVEVQVVNNDIATDEAAGVAFLEGLYGQEDGVTWKHTSYNTFGNQHSSNGTPFRKNYAAVGGFYNPDDDAFYCSQPFPSWTLNTTTYLWEPPVAYPTDGQPHNWNEQTQTWDAVD